MWVTFTWVRTSEYYAVIFPVLATLKPTTRHVCTKLFSVSNILNVNVQLISFSRRWLLMMCLLTAFHELALGSDFWFFRRSWALLIGTIFTSCFDVGRSVYVCNILKTYFCITFHYLFITEITAAIFKSLVYVVISWRWSQSASADYHILFQQGSTAKQLRTRVWCCVANKRCFIFGYIYQAIKF